MLFDRFEKIDCRDRLLRHFDNELLSPSTVEPSASFRSLNYTALFSSCVSRTGNASA